jgi:hypothetical protein
VFPFAANLASLEVMHLIALVTGAPGITDFGVQRFRYQPGIMDQPERRPCQRWCDRAELVGQGDRHFSLVGRDLGAERIREWIGEVNHSERRSDGYGKVRSE